MYNLRFGLLVIAIALSGNIFTLPSSRAAEVTFQCATRDGVPTTLAQSAHVETPVVLWDSPEIAIAPNMTQQAECEAGSQRFQTYHDSGVLSYITTGVMEGQLVACVAQQMGGGCRGRLFALQTTSSPRTALQRILRIRLPTEGPISHTGPRVYVDLMRYLSGEYNSAGNALGDRP